MAVAVFVFLCIVIILTYSEKLNGDDLGCFADLTKSSDRKTDVVIYSDRTIVPFRQKKFNKKDQEFEELPLITTENAIESISSFDFTKNGIADLFVVTKDGPNSHALSVYKDTENEDNEYAKLDIDIKLGDKSILILDANGDFMIDVFGKNKNDIPGFWFGDTEKQKLKSFQPLSNVDDNIIMKSASFIDLDQDCVADLVYMTNDSIKMMKNDGRGSFGAPIKLASYYTEHGDKWQSRLYLADFNKDGAMDIFIPKYESNELIVRKNTNPFHFKNLCTKARQMGINSFLPIKLELHAQHNDKQYELQKNLPIIIQDVTGDSKINAVVVMNDKEGSGLQKVFVYTIPENCKDGDTLQPDKDLTALFDGYGGPENQIKNLAFFHSGNFPLGLHFLIQTQNDNEFEWIHLEQTLVNNNFGFLSISPLNDVNPNDKRYGGLMPGVTIKAFFHDRNGNSIVLTAGNVYQSNPQNHLLPFVVFGLGVPESYIEKLVIAYSFKDAENVFTQPGVPPNAQLVLFAYPRTKMSKWRLETFLAPYITPPILAIIIAVVMGILGGLWAYLEVKEKKLMKDDKLKTGSATTNNFFF